MGKKIDEMTLSMLIEYQEENKLSDTKMAALIDVSVESYRRWKKRISLPNQAIVLNRIANVLEEYKVS